jgi:hypothetical protein
VDDRAHGLVDEVDHLAHGGCQRRSGNDDLAGLDDRGVASFVEERPHQPGLVLAVQIRRNVDVRHIASSHLSA